MTHAPVTGLILAGGLARRIGGGDKPLRVLAGRTLLSRSIARLAPQCSSLLLNANGDPARFAATGLPVVADTVEGTPGPLAGILAGLDHLARSAGAGEWMLSVSGDCPFLPEDLVARLAAARQGASADIAVAASGAETHYTIALWPVALRDVLHEAVAREQLRAVHRFLERFRVARVEWPVTPHDPFFNVNTPDDLALAETIIRRSGLD